MRTRRIITTVLAAGTLVSALALAPAAVAQTSTSTTLPAARDRARFNLAQSHAEAAIDRRLTWLDGLTAKVNAAAHLTADHKSTLLSLISGEHSGLAALRTKIAADTDWSTLQSDAQSIVHDYRVYLLMSPKTRLVIVSDDAEYAVTRLTSAADNLAAAGKDVTDMRAKIADVKSHADPVAAEVLPLQPQDYPGNQPTLMSARTSMQTAAADLKAAVADAKALAS